MWTYTRRAALCSIGFATLACGDPATQPTPSSESVQSSQLPSMAVTGTWRLAPSLVPARANMAAAVSDKSIVVVGGWVHGRILRRVDAFNVETRTWTQLMSLPEARAWPGAATIQGKLYVAGGLSTIQDPADPHYGDAVPHKSLFVYDPGTNRWTRKADMPGPAYATMEANLLGRLYVYAMGNDFTPDHFFAYGPAADKWVQLRLPPSRHFGGVMTALDGKLYLTNGLTRATVNPYNSELDVYDPATRSWTVKRPMLRYGGSTGTVAVPFHGKLWVAGTPSEFVTDSTGSHYLSNRGVQVYDPLTDEWNYGPLMLRDTRDGAAALAGGRIYVIGGTGLTGEPTSVVQALSTSY